MLILGIWLFIDRSWMKCCINVSKTGYILSCMHVTSYICKSFLKLQKTVCGFLVRVYFQSVVKRKLVHFCIFMSNV